MRLFLSTLAAALALATAPAFAQTLDEMAGQMILLGFSGDSAGDASVRAVTTQLAEGEIGGVMYLRTNVASRDAVTEMNRGFLAATPDLPPFISLDQEGGSVERLTRAVGFEEIPSAAAIASSRSVAEARVLFEHQADAVAAWGFNVNFTPVVDLATNPANPVIAKFGRSFSAGANIVTAYAEQAIAAHQAAGLVTSLKHFPGHGSSAGDTHEGYVDITESWDDTELAPYRALIAQGYSDFVMVGHLVKTDISPLPASLSPEWITGVLRDDLGFKGVVISDDLEMGAIRQHYGLRETVRRAVLAGMDVLLFSNTSKPRASLGDEVRAILVEEAEADPAFRARIEESYGRIVALKGRMGRSTG
ncbi:beta-N-acetylhexosaminidase [Devosia enhydra]|uniref:beta-N-acetylhexosaminidase n=1 Tax=Devosia enhydra TaxID=665118 RepID=A0A1K2HVJ4_9HYPH|nr:glycoside hydrolase family 3 N-terminal domain-containing protein [Devosia enhydra]SFZ82740.1 beta-N-acetylhexosaminidase [Devosia enhydra]